MSSPLDGLTYGMWEGLGFGFTFGLTYWLTQEARGWLKKRARKPRRARTPPANHNKPLSVVSAKNEKEANQ